MAPFQGPRFTQPLPARRPAASGACPEDGRPHTLRGVPELLPIQVQGGLRPPLGGGRGVGGCSRWLTAWAAEGRRPPRRACGPPLKGRWGHCRAGRDEGCGGAGAAACPPRQPPSARGARRRGGCAHTSPAAPGVLAGALIPGVSSEHACLKRRGQQGLSLPPAPSCRGPATPPLEARFRAASGAPQTIWPNLACTRIALLRSGQSALRSFQLK